MVVPILGGAHEVRLEELSQVHLSHARAIHQEQFDDARVIPRVGCAYEGLVKGTLQLGLLPVVDELWILEHELEDVMPPPPVATPQQVSRPSGKASSNDGSRREAPSSLRVVQGPHGSMR